MNPQELSSYFTHLLRSEPEVVAAFFMGALFAGMVVFTVRKWASSDRHFDIELAKKDAEIARKDGEVARKDAQIARVEALIENQKETLSEQERLVALLRHQVSTAVPVVPDQHQRLAERAAVEARCGALEAENRRLVQAGQSLEQAAANLRTELAQAVDELAHWAKWSRVLDEENARLMESGSLSQG